MSIVVRRAAWPRLVLVAPLALCLALCLSLGLALVAAPRAAAQDAAAGLAPGTGALVAADTLLRAQPGYDAAVLTPLLPGTPVEVLGGPIADLGGTRWYSVSFGGQSGYLPVDALGAAPASEPVPEPADAVEDPPVAEDPSVAEEEPDAVAAPAVEAPAPSAELAPPTAGEATASALLNLRAGPSYADEVLRVLPPGAPLTVTGPAQAGFLPVAYDGTPGWVDAAYLLTGAAPDPPPTTSGPAPPAPSPTGPPSPAGAATVTEPLNLRAGPAAAAPVLLVMPAGAALETTGAAQDGFVPVLFAGQTGWAAADFLSFDGAPAPATSDPAEPTPDADEVDATSSAPSDTPPPSSGGIAFPFAGGTWEVIQGYNNGTHTYRGPQADYRYSLDWARADGNTAGQPVYAPVSGTVRWASNGGMLIDTGNGYGVAMFHVTFDGFSSGQSVQQGQPLGVVSGPGGPGYAGTPHVDLTLWQLGAGANVSTPFTGANAIAGQDFPDAGTGNQHMGVTVTP